MMNTTSIPGLPHHQTPRSRREFLARSGGGFGAVAAAALLAQQSRAADLSKLQAPTANKANPLAARKPHYAGTAKSVIFVFLEGGPSHIDLFDPKPLVNQLAGKPPPESFVGNLITAMGESRSPILEVKR